MRALTRKLARDSLRLKWQAAAIALVLASGVATFAMSLSSLSSLQAALDAYYERHRFGEVFAHLKRAPESLRARLAEIPGVAWVDTRIAMDVNLDVPGFAEPAVGRLISLPDSGEPALNRLYYRMGRPPDPQRRSEAVISEAFAAAHGLRPGDSIAAMINGRLEGLDIVGIAISPEFIYEIREGEVLPDSKRFGVAWMLRRDIAAAFDMEGAFNSLVATLMPGASEPEVLAQIDSLIEPYGGLGAYGRSEQTSHVFLDNELTQLRAMAVLAPSIFLAVAAFLLHMVASRLIGTQREQIAILRAFGYTRAAIARHYLAFVMVIVVVGSAIGMIAGAWMGRDLTRLYTKFFHFPVLGYRLDPRILLVALGVSTVAGFAGTIGAVRRAAMLPPAEAMRPEAPATYRPTMIERIGFERLMTSSARMVVRHLERQPLRAGLACLGMALATGILVLGAFMEDTVDYVLDFQFARSQRQDMTIALREASSADAVREVAHMPGVRAVEPFRALPVRMWRGHREERIVIMGLPPERDLFVPLDASARPVLLPDAGLVLSKRLTELLDVRVGQTVWVEVLEGARPVVEVSVRAIFTDYLGRTAYMTLAAAQQLMREGDVVSGAYVSADSHRDDDVYRQLKRTPGVAGVTVREASVRVFRETIAENLLRMRSFNIAFACIIAFGVVFNTARISLAERSREFATLRVIGFTRGEVSAILLGELAVITVAAVPLGLAIGYGFAASLTVALKTSNHSFPLVVDSGTFAFAALTTVAAAGVSGLIVRRSIDRLDLVAVLKSRE